MIKAYEWLFSEEERTPIAFIPTFFMNILLSIVVTLFILALNEHYKWFIQ